MGDLRRQERLWKPKGEHWRVNDKKNQKIEKIRQKDENGTAGGEITCRDNFIECQEKPKLRKEEHHY